jgi:DNA processing protein
MSHSERMFVRWIVFGAKMNEAAALLARLQASPKRWAAIADEVELEGTALQDNPADVNQRSLFAEPHWLSNEIADAESLIRSWREEGMSFASLLDENYPPQLLTIHQRPPFVMWRGVQSSLDAAGVCVVGSRAASAEGCAKAKELGAGLARKGVTVISGLALGIDTAAHLGALEAGGRTVAVIGTGLRR